MAEKKKPGPPKGTGKKYGHLFSFRIPGNVDEVLHPRTDKRSVLCEDFLRDSTGECPLCEQEWPTENFPLERVGIRLNDPVYEKISKYPSNYVRACILVGLGICPLCHQRMVKK